MTSQNTLGELASRYPGASKIFFDLGLDYCCGGSQSFDAACRKKNLDPDKVLNEIRSQDNAPSNLCSWEEKPLSELIEYILARYHARLREDLPRLIKLAAKVEKVHAENPECPVGLHQHLVDISVAVGSHLAKEEQILFPLIESGQLNTATGPIKVLISEHHRHGEDLQKIRHITGNHNLPPEACATWSELYRSLRLFEKDLMDHIHLENNILFDRVKKILIERSPS